ncbi:hypothetical protein DSLASN_24810 [Desulfoluna limicola]|uniref:Uncharacterized protein n=1 Tax=Desulfoluna limicola TaxID=2810562 RepID=A0ABM7PIG5_9BACT|nr:hypothetical protein DSLASN_24810 [Desulfoluna limicola]
MRLTVNANMGLVASFYNDGWGPAVAAVRNAAIFRRHSGLMPWVFYPLPAGVLGVGTGR